MKFAECIEGENYRCVGTPKRIIIYDSSNEQKDLVDFPFFVRRQPRLIEHLQEVGAKLNIYLTKWEWDGDIQYGTYDEEGWICDKILCKIENTSVQLDIQRWQIVTDFLKIRRPPIYDLDLEKELDIEKNKELYDVSDLKIPSKFAKENGIFKEEQYITSVRRLHGT